MITNSLKHLSEVFQREICSYIIMNVAQIWPTNLSMVLIKNKLQPNKMY